MKPVEVSTDDPVVVKAISHPLRLQILLALEQGVASPKELADRLGARLGTVAYHVRVLADLGFVSVARQTPKRGAVESHYRLRKRPRMTPTPGQPPGPAKLGGPAALAVRKLTAAVKEAAAGGGLEAEGVRASSRRVDLDDRGVQELRSALVELDARVDEIERRAEKRLRDGREPPQHTLLGVLSLPAADKPGRRRTVHLRT